MYKWCAPSSVHLMNTRLERWDWSPVFQPLEQNDSDLSFQLAAEVKYDLVDAILVASIMCAFAHQFYPQFNYHCHHRRAKISPSCHSQYALLILQLIIINSAKVVFTASITLPNHLNHRSAILFQHLLIDRPSDYLYRHQIYSLICAVKLAPDQC